MFRQELGLSRDVIGGVCDYRNMGEEQDWVDMGERVKRARLAFGISQSDLAEAVGLDRTMVAKVESGRRRLDALELSKIASKLSVPMTLLVESRPAVLSHRAVQLAEDSDTDVARNTERLDGVLATWLGDLRQLVALGVLKTPRQLAYPGKVTSSDEARKAAAWLRQQLGLALRPIESMSVLCEQAGQFLLLTEVPGDGASVIDGNVAGSVVSLTGDPGRRRATAAHELGHFVLGDEYSSDLGIHASRNDREGAIQAFAAELLMPIDALRGEGGPLTRDALIVFAARYRTSWSLALKQAERANLLDRSQRERFNASKPTYVEFREALGWAPQPDLHSVRVPPAYAHAVIAAWRADLLTTSRAVELMHGQISREDLPSRDDTDTAS